MDRSYDLLAPASSFFRDRYLTLAVTRWWSEDGLIASILHPPLPPTPPVFPLDLCQAIGENLDLSTTVIPNFTERKLYNRFLIHIEGEERVGRAGTLKDGTGDADRWTSMMSFLQMIIVAREVTGVSLICTGSRSRLEWFVSPTYSPFYLTHLAYWV